MFKRISITVPAAGVNLLIKENGCGIIVESMKSYPSPVDVPILLFNNESENPQPLYQNSKYSCPDFTRFYIQGTSQSVGDIIYLLISNQVVIQEITPMFNISVLSENGLTQQIASTNIAQFLPNAILYSTGAVTGKKAKSIVIQCETNDIRYAIETVVIAGGVGHLMIDGVNSVSSIIKIEGFSFINNFNFISNVADTHGVLNITPEY